MFIQFKKNKYLLFCILLFSATHAYSQANWAIIKPSVPTNKMNFELMGSLYKRGSSFVDLYIKKSKVPCANANGAMPTQCKFQLEMENMSNYSNLGNYLIWKMDITNCNGESITTTRSIDLANFHEDGMNESKDWQFEATDMPTNIYDIHFSYNADYTKDVNRGIMKPTAPDSIISPSYYSSGNRIKLNLAGGKIPSTAKWYWFVDSCGGIALDSASILQTTINQTSTYYVMGMQDGLPITPCISKLIVVNDSSYAADEIKSSLRSICANSSVRNVKLEVVNGRLGKGGKWVWYADKCGDKSKKINVRGNGTQIEVTPTKTTTYYVRAEGDANVTECVEFTVDYRELSELPDQIDVSNFTVCRGEKVVLSINGGSLKGNDKWIWSSFKKNGTETILDSGITRITQFPTESTVYYLRAKGDCGATNKISTTVDVPVSSTNPTRYNFNNSKKFSKFDISLYNGNLASNSSYWIWKADGSEIHRGRENSIDYKTKTYKTITVNAMDSCGEVTLNPLSFYLNPTRERPSWDWGGFFNFGAMLNPSDSLRQYVFTIAWHPKKWKRYHWKKYHRIKFRYHYSRDSSITFLNPQYECNNQGLINYNGTYNFNSKVYARRFSYTLGYVANLSNQFNFYFGAGYGVRTLVWGVDLYTPVAKFKQFATNKEASIQGIEGEAGLMLRMGPLNLMGGVNMISASGKRFIDCDLGIGVGF